eukprot:3639008-Amphidinium_carterae.1
MVWDIPKSFASGRYIQTGQLHSWQHLTVNSTMSIRESPSLRCYTRLDTPSSKQDAIGVVSEVAQQKNMFQEN